MYIEIYTEAVCIFNICVQQAQSLIFTGGTFDKLVEGWEGNMIKVNCDNDEGPSVFGL